MRTYPERDYEIEELKDLNAEQWQVDALKMNPSYVFWGPYEDCMSSGGSWEENQFFETWKQFGPWKLDDLNECVNFYFFIRRESHTCDLCNGEGYNPETKKISDNFYDFEHTGNRWCNSITQDEVVELVKHGRLFDFLHCYYDEDSKKWFGWKNKKRVEIETPEMPSAHEVNEWNKKNIGHDAINRHILTKTRAKRLGVYGKCQQCEGRGVVYDEPEGKLGIVLWFLHPRKGASRAVEVKEIKREELEEIKAFLRFAEERNKNRFSAIV